jgi:acetolactate synthase-1/2/3 large subunit
MSTTRHGGQILADQLVIQGCEVAFCVPGESFLALLDGLHDTQSVRTVVCRQEGGAAMMAEAHGKLTGKPGVCMVTRGPGATNAASGVHVAYQDSTPMILLIGQVGREMMDREAFQEIDYRRMFGQMAKWVAQVDDTRRLPEYISRAYHIAMSGRPGPVVLALPEDVLSGFAEVEDTKPANPAVAKAAPDDVDAFKAMLEGAERPMMIVGGGGWDAQTSADIQRFSEANNIPVCASFRCQDYFDNAHPNYCGLAGLGINPKTAARFDQCDLLISVGSRLGEITSGGYEMFGIPNLKMKFVHVHPGADEIGHMYRPDLAVNSASPQFAKAISSLQLSSAERWKEWTDGASAEYREGNAPKASPGDFQLEQAVLHVAQSLGPNDVVTNGAGNYAAWVNKYYTYRNYRTQLAPTSGSMGYGLPAAVASAIARPNDRTICFAGDGCFMMTGQELATAVAQELDMIIIVANNGMYGTIRMHQERHYPERVHGTGLVNPNFADLAKSYGAHGTRVTTNAEFETAFADALTRKGPVLIEALMDPNALSPTATMEEIRAQGLANQAGASA